MSGIKDKIKEYFKKAKTLFWIWVVITIASMLITAFTLIVAKNLGTQGSCPYDEGSLGLSGGSSAIVSISSIINLATSVFYDKDNHDGILQKYRKGILTSTKFQAVVTLVLLLYVMLLGATFTLGLTEISAKELVKRMVIVGFFIWGTRTSVYDFYDNFLDPLVFETLDGLTGMLTKSAGMTLVNPDDTSESARQFKLYLEQSTNNPYAIFDAVTIVALSRDTLTKLASLSMVNVLFFLIVPMFYIFFFRIILYMVAFAATVIAAKLSIIVGLSIFPMFLPFAIFDVGLKSRTHGVKDKFKTYFEEIIMKPVFYISLVSFVNAFVVALILRQFADLMHYATCYYKYFSPPSVFDIMPPLAEFLTLFYWAIPEGQAPSFVGVMGSFTQLILLMSLFKKTMEWAQMFADGLTIGFGTANSASWLSKMLTGGHGFGNAGGFVGSMINGENGIKNSLYGKRDNKKDSPHEGQRRGGLVGQIGKLSPGAEQFIRNPIKSSLSFAYDKAESARKGAYHKLFGAQSQKDYDKKSANQQNGFNANYAFKMADKNMERAASVMHMARMYTKMPKGDSIALRREFKERMEKEGFGKHETERMMLSLLLNYENKGNRNKPLHHDKIKGMIANAIRQGDEDGKIITTSMDSDGKTVTTVQTTEEAALKAFLEDYRINTKNSLMTDQQLGRFFDERYKELQKSGIFKYETPGGALTKKEDILQNDDKKLEQNKQQQSPADRHDITFTKPKDADSDNKDKEQRNNPANLVSHAGEKEKQIVSPTQKVEHDTKDANKQQPTNSNENTFTVVKPAVKRKTSKHKIMPLPQNMIAEQNNGNNGEKANEVRRETNLGTQVNSGQNQNIEKNQEKIVQSSERQQSSAILNKDQDRGNSQPVQRETIENSGVKLSQQDQQSDTGKYMEQIGQRLKEKDDQRAALNNEPIVSKAQDARTEQPTNLPDAMNSVMQPPVQQEVQHKTAEQKVEQATKAQNEAIEAQKKGEDLSNKINEKKQQIEQGGKKDDKKE